MRDRREPPGAETAAQARLAAELDDSVGRTRIAWEAASLRGDAALRLGDRAEAIRALDEQRALLRDLHAQVDRALGRAAAAREPERVVTSREPTRPSSPPGSARRHRAPAGALTGAVLAAALGLVALLPGSPPAHEVAGLAADDPPAGADDLTGDAGASDGTADLLGPTVEAAGDARPLGSFLVVFDRVTDVLGELHDALAGEDEGPPPPSAVDEAPRPADEGGIDEGGPTEVAPADDGASDAPTVPKVEGLPDPLEPDPEDEGSDRDDPPGRLDLNGRFGGGAPEGAGTIDGIVERLDPR